MITNPKSDLRRQIVPLPNGERPTREKGTGTMLRLTDLTGLTVKDKEMPLGRKITSDTAVPGMARLFNTFPGVERKDFVPWARPLLNRKS